MSVFPALFNNKRTLLFPTTELVSQDLPELGFSWELEAHVLSPWKLTSFTNNHVYINEMNLGFSGNTNTSELRQIVYFKGTVAQENLLN